MKKIRTLLKETPLIHRLTAAGFIILVLGVGYLIWADMRTSAEIQTLSQSISVLQLGLASTTQATHDLHDSLAQTQNTLTNAISDQRQNVGAIQSQLGTYQQQVGTITGTLTTLQKLSKTDPQLLEKYSKVFFLNENYDPAELTQVPDAYNYSSTKHTLISAPVWPYLKDLMDAASSSGIQLYVFSGYRSFNEQSALKSDYKVTFGAGTANSFSADQGYSEHQLGTALDFMTSGLGGKLDDRFASAPAYQWLINNAYRYGFILSYPKNNPYYVYEPWHWRFVGTKLATDLHAAGAYFYDWDQRTIDTYLVKLFD